jgi:hypothetical protein
VAGGDERGVDAREHLLGATGGVGAYGGERIRDVEDRELHAISSSASAAPASARQRAPSMPQS